MFACVSHKGGTGRSVATANIAYRIALEKEVDVCIVDLDVDSPTFASVLQIPDLATGANVGIRSYLAESDADRIPVDTFVSSGGAGIIRDVGRKARGDLFTEDEFPFAGELALVPGSASRSIDIPKFFGARMKTLVDRLRAAFDVVFIDVAAGESDALMSLGEAIDLGAEIDAWLLYCRWTPQHLAAAADLRNRLRELTPDVPVQVIRTAVPDFSVSPWFTEQNEKLKDQFKRAFRDPRDTRLAIPFEPVFQWKECVLTNRSKLEYGDDVVDTIDAFRSIADYLLSEY